MKEIVLLIAEIFRPGGTNRVVVNLANKFTDEGYKVSVYSVNSSEGAPYYALHKNVEIKHLNVPLARNVAVRSTIGLYKTYKALIKATQDGQIIIATDPISCFALAFIKRKYNKRICIAAEHMGIAVSAKHSAIARKKLYKYLDAVTVLNAIDKDLLELQQVQMKHCAVIPNEVSFYPEQTPDYSVKKMVTVGRYVPQKGYDILINILSSVLPKHKDWSVDIIGDGYMRDELQKKIDQENLSDQVKLLQPTQNIIEAYLSASVYLLPSRFEGFPMVLLEAKACGLPCIAFDCPAGPAEIVEPNDGRLIPFLDEVKFAEAMEELMQNPGLRTELGKNAKQNVLKYSTDAVYQKWNQLFRQVSEN